MADREKRTSEKLLEDAASRLRALELLFWESGLAVYDVAEARDAVVACLDRAVDQYRREWKAKPGNK